MFEVARDYACLARKRSVDGPNALATFVGTASQQVPTDTGQIKQWLRSADDEIVGISEEVKATMSSNADQLRQLIDNLSASIGKQLKDIKDNAVAARDSEIALREEMQALEAQTSMIEARIYAFENSTSWKLTSPLRFFKTRATWFTRGTAASLKFKHGSRSWRIAHRAAISLARFTLTRPRLAQQVRNLLRRFPKTEAPLRAILTSKVTAAAPTPFPVTTMSDMSMSTQHANRIYIKLKAAGAKSQRSA
ncbi:hypothetical protein EOD23_07380 [Mesorhizobium sp. USDA-HM6]|nr:hypothetical protein EOD23_07380 [Mesorhizobium sp. USDA-HM6]